MVQEGVDGQLGTTLVASGCDLVKPPAAFRSYKNTSGIWPSNTWPTVS
jgi:hypothetical protein